MSSVRFSSSSWRSRTSSRVNKSARALRGPAHGRLGLESLRAVMTLAILALLLPGAVRAQAGSGAAAPADTAAAPVVPPLAVPVFPDSLAAPAAPESLRGGAGGSRAGTVQVGGYPKPYLVLLRSAVIPGWGQWTNRK